MLFGFSAYVFTANRVNRLVLYGASCVIRRASVVFAHITAFVGSDFKSVQICALFIYALSYSFESIVLSFAFWTFVLHMLHITIFRLSLETCVYLGFHNRSCICSLFMLHTHDMSVI